MAKSETSQFLDAFTFKYENTTGDMLLVNAKKARIFAKRILKSTCLEDAIELVEFLFDNWTDIQYAMKLSSNLSLNLLATYSMMERFKYFKENGIPDNPNMRGVNMDEYTMEGFYENL